MINVALKKNIGKWENMFQETRNKTDG